MTCHANGVDASSENMCRRALTGALHRQSAQSIEVTASIAMPMQVLGKGAFGTVYLATDKADNRQYACKSINKAKLVTEVGAPPPCSCSGMAVQATTCSFSAVSLTSG